MKIFILAVILFLFTVCSVSAEQSLIDDIKDAGVIRIGTTGDYGPFSYVNKQNDGVFYGLDIDLANDLAKSMNVRVEFVKTTWSTLMDDLLTGKFDVGMSGISINAAREEMAMFSIPLMPDGKAAIARDEQADQFKTISAINQPHVRVIFNPGGTNEQFARQNFPNATLILNEDNITIFQKIVDGDADVMVTDAIETIVQQEVHPELVAVNPDTPFNQTKKGYMFKKDLVFKSYIDKWIKSRLENGAVQLLQGQHIENYVRLKK